MNYGRVPFVTEVEAKEIRAINRQRQTEHKKHALMVRRKIEAYQADRALNERIYR